jgi:hypothetical protein
VIFNCIILSSRTVFCSFLADFTQGAQEQIRRHNCQSCHPNHARYGKSCRIKISSVPIENLIKVGQRLMELGGKHADQPVVLRSRHASDQQDRPWFPWQQVNLWKVHQSHLTWALHVHRS